MRHSRRPSISSLILIFGVVLFATAAQAQLVGTDTAPGESCAGSPAGATRMTADADQDGKEVTLICDGSNWVAAGGTATPAGTDRQIQFNSGGSLSADANFVFNSAGNVGIGTATPGYPLSVDGSIYAEVDEDYGAAMHLVQHASGGLVARFSGDKDYGLDIAAKDWSTRITAGVSDFYGAAYCDTTEPGWIHNMGGWGTGGLVVESVDCSGGVGNAGTVEERMRITHSGNVGIGTDDPVTLLDVAGEIRFSSAGLACDATTEGAQRYDTATGAMEYCDGAGWTALGSGSGTPAGATTQIQFNSGGAFGSDANFVFDSTTVHVGIGIADPDHHFHLYTVDGIWTEATMMIEGLAAARLLMSAGNSVGMAAITTTDGGAYGGILGFHTNSSSGCCGSTSGGPERMRIDHNGHVGIGTESPNTRLHVNTTDTTEWLELKLTNPATGAATTDGFVIGTDANEVHSYVWNKEAGDLYFGAGDAEYMRLTSAGRLGIGTNAPQERLQVADGNVLLSSGGVIAAGTAPYAILTDNLDNANDVLVDTNPWVDTLVIGKTSNGTLINAIYEGGSGMTRGIFNIGSYDALIGTTYDVTDPFGAQAQGMRIRDDETDIYAYGLRLASFNVGSGYTRFYNPWDDTETVMEIDSTGNVGIGTESPASALDVAGGVKVANDAAACASSKEGTIRYVSSSDPPWEFCDGSAWVNFKQPRCQDDDTGECYLDATRSNDDPEFIAGNIADGVNILGVTGTLSGGLTGPSGCANIGDECADGTVFAGWHPITYDHLFIPTTDQEQPGSPGTFTMEWKNATGTDDIDPDSDNDGQINHANRGGAIGDFQAFQTCVDLSFGGHSDWYLPSRVEIYYIWAIHETIEAGGNITNFSNDTYWSSSELATNVAWNQSFINGFQSSGDKNFAFWVRCIRR